MVFEHFEEKEAVKKAAMIEENGVRFYTLLSEKTQDEAARAVFKKLARDEKKHFKVVEEKFFPEAGYSEQITEEELALEEYIERPVRRISLRGGEMWMRWSVCWITPGRRSW